MQYDSAMLLKSEYLALDLQKESPQKNELMQSGFALPYEPLN